METNFTPSDMPADKLANLEQRLEKLETIVSQHSDLIYSRVESFEEYSDPFIGEEDKNAIDTVSFIGYMNSDSRNISFLWTRSPQDLIQNSWDESFRRVAALAHPLRGVILKHLLHSPSSVTQLCEAGIVSSTGTAYHHLNELEVGGWVRKFKKGKYEIPPERVIPLLVIVAASEEH